METLSRVMLGFLLALLVSCGPEEPNTTEDTTDGAIETANSQALKDAKKELTSLKAEKKKAAKSAGTLKADETPDDLDKMRADLQSSEEYASKLKAAVTEVEKELEQWRGAARASFEGLEVGTFATNDGQTITQGIIAKVSDKDVSFTTATGPVTITFENLNNEFRKRLVYEETATATVEK